MSFAMCCGAASAVRRVQGLWPKTEPNGVRVDGRSQEPRLMSEVGAENPCLTCLEPWRCRLISRPLPIYLSPVPRVIRGLRVPQHGRSSVEREVGANGRAAGTHAPATQSERDVRVRRGQHDWRCMHLPWPIGTWMLLGETWRAGERGVPQSRGGFEHLEAWAL